MVQLYIKYLVGCLVGCEKDGVENLCLDSSVRRHQVRSSRLQDALALSPSLPDNLEPGYSHLKAKLLITFSQERVKTCCGEKRDLEEQINPQLGLRGVLGLLWSRIPSKRLILSWNEQIEEMLYQNDGTLDGDRQSPSLLDKAKQVHRGG